MKKLYLTFVLADKPHAVDIATIEDHQAVGPVEFSIGGPRISLFKLILTFFNLKHLIEDCYVKLDESQVESDVKEVEYDRR